jgi:hypothetical protein
MHKLLLVDTPVSLNAHSVTAFHLRSVTRSTGNAADAAAAAAGAGSESDASIEPGTRSRTPSFRFLLTMMPSFSWKNLDAFSKPDDPDVMQVKTSTGAVGAVRWRESDNSTTRATTWWLH